MGDRIATVVIEARALLREALVSLMENHSYDVFCSVGSTADLDRGGSKEVQPQLVLLGALPTDRVAGATSSIRGRWPGAKIVMLFEKASAMDLQELSASGLDACIPIFASPRTLIDTLQLVVCQDLRVLMVSDSAITHASIDLQEEDEDGAAQDRHAPGASHTPSVQGSASRMPCARVTLAKNPGDNAGRGGGAHGLSEREEQILKALVRGHSNKMIARLCTVTEATVKVHMKSILRKIRVENRTQAAIWALKNAYFADSVNQTALGTAPGVDAVPLATGHNY
jgi:two-component system nitrate/nitrite response regulator NarL